MTGEMTPQTTLALMQASQGANASTTDKINNARNQEKAQEAAKEFEAMFIAEMMKPMFEGIKTDGAFGGGKGEEVFRGMLVQEYGKLIAETGQVGMSDHVKQELIKMQEKIDAN